MATVDPEEDGIRRFIALHHRYDQRRREWRDVPLRAFDDEREFQEFLDERNAELQARQAAGGADPKEHVSGVIREPGHRERSQNQRLLRRALEHGVWPPGWNPHDPPDGVSVVTAGDPDRPA
jgi:hypothetical protein